MVEKATVIKLAQVAGIEISDDDLDEVSNRFSSLMQEMELLNELDLKDIHPISIFVDETET